MGLYYNRRDAEKEIIAKLEELNKKIADPDTLKQEAQRMLYLQPNFFGLGVNLNEMIDSWLKRKKSGESKRRIHR